jgi:pyridoxine 5-phosphate synthase
MASLIISIDQIAFFRNIFGGDYPDPSHAAVLAQLSGIEGIAGRLRRDRQLIRDRDLYVLREVVKGRLFLYIYPDPELMERAIEVRPDLVVLTPESDHPFKWGGITFETDGDRYFKAAEKLKDENIRVGFFIDPEEISIKEAARARVHHVILNGSEYTAERNPDNIRAEWDCLEYAGQLAIKLGLEAGITGGLGGQHLRSLIRSELFTYIILGRGLVSRAVMIGLEKAVGETAAEFRDVGA